MLVLPAHPAVMEEFVETMDVEVHVEHVLQEHRVTLLDNVFVHPTVVDEFVDLTDVEVHVEPVLEHQPVTLLDNVFVHPTVVDELVETMDVEVRVDHVLEQQPVTLLDNVSQFVQPTVTAKSVETMDVEVHVEPVLQEQFVIQELVSHQVEPALLPTQFSPLLLVQLTTLLVLPSKPHSELQPQPMVLLLFKLLKMTSLPSLVLEFKPSVLRSPELPQVIHSLFHPLWLPLMCLLVPFGIILKVLISICICSDLVTEPNILLMKELSIGLGLISLLNYLTQHGPITLVLGDVK